VLWCCETRSCHARRHNDLEGHSNFSSTIYSFSILCLEQDYCGDQQYVVFTHLKDKSAKCLCLLPVVLVIRIWSCLHHCPLEFSTLQWLKWSCEAGVGGGSPDEARLEQTPYPFHTQLIWRYLGIK